MMMKIFILYIFKLFNATVIYYTRSFKKYVYVKCFKNKPIKCKGLQISTNAKSITFYSAS